MYERIPSRQEQEPKREDAGKLAETLYFILDRETCTQDSEVGEAAETLGHYIEFRAQQDPEMAHLLVDAFESFRDPQPEVAKLQSLEGMQEHANRIRTMLGLPDRELPTEIPAPPTEPWVAPL